MRLLFCALLLAQYSFISYTPHTIKSATAKEIIYQSADGGSHWSDISDGLPKGVSPNCFHPTDGELLLGTEHGVYRKNAKSLWQKDPLMNESIVGFMTVGSTVYSRSYDKGIFQEMASISSWVQAFTALKDKYVRRICTMQDGNLFSYSDLGIFKSTNNGLSWTMVYSDEIVQSLNEFKGVFIANAGRGLIRSTDKGITWKKVPNSEMIWNIIETEGILLACGNKGLYQSADKGAHWQQTVTEFGQIYEIKKINNRLVINSNGQVNQNDIIGPLTNKLSHLHYSEDNGKTWQNMDKSLALNYSIRGLVKHGKYIFCSHEKGVSRTSDWGKTWELVLPVSENMGYQMSVKGNMLYCMKTLFGGC